MEGSANLRRRYAEARLVAFSSSSAPLGVVGQATYGAANAHLDETLKGDSIQWGGWGELGMVVTHGISPLAGERFLSVESGLRVLGMVLDAPGGRDRPTLVADVDWLAYSANASV